MRWGFPSKATTRGRVASSFLRLIPARRHPFWDEGTGRSGNTPTIPNSRASCWTVGSNQATSFLSTMRVGLRPSLARTALSAEASRPNALVASRLATGYALGRRGARAVPDREWIGAGAGGIYSTARDMARFAGVASRQQHGEFVTTETRNNGVAGGDGGTQA